MLFAITVFGNNRYLLFLTFNNSTMNKVDDIGLHVSEYQCYNQRT